MIITRQEAAVGKASDSATLIAPPLFELPLTTAEGYPERVTVPDGLRSWDRKFTDYQPPFYESPRLAANDRTRIPGGWADPACVTRDELMLWSKTGYMHSYEGPIRHDPETGYPLNPLGRLGIAGRGLLGKWGPNHASDAMLTRVGPTSGLLEVLLIQRKSGEWALPGGMVDSGETPRDAAYRELQEETGLSMDGTRPRLVYQGICDGPRLTDNAWIESSVYHFHLAADSPVSTATPRASDDAHDAKWSVVTPELLYSLYANHREHVGMALSQFRALRPNVSEQVAAQLAQLPHHPLLTSFSELRGRVGIFGGTFDPVHLGHLELARKLKDLHQLDAVVFIPNAQNPLKDAATKASGQERVHMLCYGLKDEPEMFVAPLQVRMPGKSFTIDMLRTIREQVSEEQAQLFLMLGADCIPQFPRWKEPREILASVDVVAVSRSGTASPLESAVVREQLAGELGSTAARKLWANFSSIALPAVSSTEIRRGIAAGDLDVSSLPVDVAGYIKARKLYVSGVSGT
jgi:ADP-ribose pyrophosphatase